MDEDKAKKQKPKDTGEGDKPETDAELERQNDVPERMEKATAERNALLDREDKREAEKAIGGESEAGLPPVKPEVLSDIEYSKKVALGEANPLAEDGFK